MKNTLILSIMIVLSAFSCTALGQTNDSSSFGSISGRIDPPLSNVSITIQTLEPNTTEMLKLVILSQDSGIFYVDKLPFGNYSISIQENQSSGFLSTEMPIVVSTNSTLTGINITLTLTNASEPENTNLTGPLPYVDPEVYSELENKSQAYVLVGIVDDTGITLSREDSTIQKQNKIEQQHSLLGNKTDLILSSLSSNEFVLEENVGYIGIFTGNITKRGLDRLQKNPDIKFIYLNIPMHISLNESGIIINANQAHDLGYTGENQTVCILDTGIDYNLEDLGGCIGDECKVIAGKNYVGAQTSNDPLDDKGHGTFIAGIISSNNTGNLFN